MHFCCSCHGVIYLKCCVCFIYFLIQGLCNCFYICMQALNTCFFGTCVCLNFWHLCCGLNRVSCSKICCSIASHILWQYQYAHDSLWYTWMQSAHLFSSRRVESPVGVLLHDPLMRKLKPCYIFQPFSPSFDLHHHSRGGVPWMQKLRTPLVGALGYKSLSLCKAVVRQNIALHASFAFPFHRTSFFSQTSLILEQWNVRNIESKFYLWWQLHFVSPWYDPSRLTWHETPSILSIYQHRFPLSHLLTTLKVAKILSPVRVIFSGFFCTSDVSRGVVEGVSGREECGVEGGEGRVFVERSRWYW